MSENTVTREKLYGKNTDYNSRISATDTKYQEIFGITSDISHFSAPGRTEICGNHTDHNLGKVLAGAVNLDVLAAACKANHNIIKLKSEGFDMDVVDSLDLSIHKDEYTHSPALIRGMCAAFVNAGYKIGGFYAYTTSNVLKGSGLSSSAAFEVLIGTILNHFYNDGKISPVEIAKMAQFAENEYFGKPSGLMDQMASSVGGFVAIDFKDNKNPVIENIDFDFEKAGYSLCITDTKADHADLTDDYSAIKNEMAQVAEFFSAKVLRDVDEKDFYSNIRKIRENCSDRAIIRAIHYFNDNKNVDLAKNALQSGDFEAFKKTIQNSGNSSYMYLQNIYSAQSPTSQAASLALAISHKILGNTGAFRIHGGGFGGTIQAFVPNNLVNTYKAEMEKILGENSCYILNIRKFGGVLIND